MVLTCSVNSSQIGTQESGTRKFGLDPADGDFAFGSPCTEVTWGQFSKNV